MGLDKAAPLSMKGLTAQELMDCFVEKIEATRKSTGGSGVGTRLPEETSNLLCFAEYCAQDIREVIETSPTESCSQDSIPTSILKEFLPELLPFITRMCNQSLKEGVLPASQKKAVIMPILKKAGSDHMDVKNYRPISNLTFMSKLVEKLVYRQLVIYLEESRLLPKFQSGFRSGHSTETALQKVLSDILTAADSGRVSILGLLDMSATFDTVDHAILFKRLKSAYGFSGTVHSWVCSFLTDREQRVVFNGQFSSTSTVRFGVPQGSVLGPLFFLLYTADIQHIAEEFGLGVHCYADDGQLYFYEKASALPSVLSKVATCITEIDRWMNSNRLKLNSDKTQFIWLGSRHELLKVSIVSIDLGSCEVKFRDSVNNLGVVIDGQLSMKDHVQKVCKTCYYHLRQLRSIRGSLSVDSCSALVRAFISSRLDYCNSLLTGIDKSQVNKLQSILRVAARLVMRKGKFESISNDIRDKLH